MPVNLEGIRRICANAAAAQALADAGVPEPEPEPDADLATAIRAVIEVHALDDPPPAARPAEPRGAAPVPPDVRWQDALVAVAVAIAVAVSVVPERETARRRGGA